MASETQTAAQQLLNSFNAKKHAVEDETAVEAQRLVNMYRNLSVFKPEFVEEFNQILLSSSKEAQVLLPSIIGGSGVREYLSYLQKAQHISPDEEETADNSDTKIQGFLPDPEHDIVSQASFSNEKSADESSSITTTSSLENMLNAFIESNHHQSVVLENALSQMQEVMKSTQQMPQQEQGHSQEMIVEILTKQQEQFQDFALMMQNMVQTQTSLLNQTLTHLTDVVGALSQKNNIPYTPAPATDNNALESSDVLDEPIVKTPKSATQSETKKSHNESKSKKKYQPVEIDDDMEILTEFDLPQED